MNVDNASPFATASASRFSTRVVHVSHNVDWLPSDRATAVFGLHLPRLETTLTNVDVDLSTQASRARSAARAEARLERERESERQWEREREDQGSRSTSQSGDLSHTPTVASTLTSHPSSSATGRSSTRSSSGAHTYSNLDIAVLVSLSRLASPTLSPSVPTLPSDPKLALTVVFSASCLDTLLSDLLEFVNVPGVSTIPALRDHLLQSRQQMPVATPPTALMEDDPLWIAAALRDGIRRTINTGAVHGDEASLTRPWFKRLTDMANQFVSAVARSANDLAQSRSTPTTARFAPSIWDGIAPGENVRPDLICPNATFDAKASMSSLEAFLAVLRTNDRAELLIDPDLVPEDAVNKIQTRFYDMNGDVLDSTGRHSGAMSLIVQVVTQMQLYHRRYGVVSAWNMGLVICRTGPATFALSDSFMPTAPADREESTTFAVLCALLLVDASSALDRERYLIEIDIVDDASEEVAERRERRRREKASQARASVRTNEASMSTHHPTATDQLRGHDPSLSDSHDPSPITPNHPSSLDNHQSRLVPSSPSSSPSSSRDMPPNPKRPQQSDTLTGGGVLRISVSPIILSKLKSTRVGGRQHIPVRFLSTYHFDPIGECDPVHVELEDFDSEGRYWTAYRGTVGKARVIVKICRLAAFPEDDEDVDEDDWRNGAAPFDEVTSEIEHEMSVMRSRALASRITCAPKVYGYWSGTRVAPSGSLPSPQPPLDVPSRPTRDRTRLIVAVMEDVGGEYSLTELHYKWDEIVAAFDQLHDAGLIHGDVATRHVRRGTDADKSGRPRLIDFGRTRFASDDEIAAEQEDVEEMLARASWSSVWKIA